METIKEDVDLMEESLEQYGNLTEEEMLELLSEIESEDDAIIEAQQDAAAKAILKSEMSEDYDKNFIEEGTEDDLLPEEKMTDDAWTYFKEWEQDEKTGKFTLKGLGMQLCSEAKDKLIERAEAARRKLEENRRTRAQQKKDISRMAFNQRLIDLSERIPESELQRLIYLLTEEHTYMINKLEAYINKRITALLKPLIPRILKLCMLRFPGSMIKHPGFMYIASKEYGNGLKLWVKPDIPYYFQQYSEMQVLKTNKPHFLYTIDKAVEQYYRHRDLRTEKETKYAIRLCGMKTNTYLGLLQLNPFWFKILYDDYKERLDTYMEEKSNKQ